MNWEPYAKVVTGEPKLPCRAAHSNFDTKAGCVRCAPVGTRFPHHVDSPLDLVFFAFDQQRYERSGSRIRPGGFRRIYEAPTARENPLPQWLLAARFRSGPRRRSFSYSRKSYDEKGQLQPRQSNKLPSADCEVISQWYGFVVLQCLRIPNVN